MSLLLAGQHASQVSKAIASVVVAVRGKRRERTEGQ
jgi:hypothetical protein